MQSFHDVEQIYRRACKRVRRARREYWYSRGRNAVDLHKKEASRERAYKAYLSHPKCTFDNYKEYEWFP